MKDFIIIIFFLLLSICVSLVIISKFYFEYKAIKSKTESKQSLESLEQNLNLLKEQNNQSQKFLRQEFIESIEKLDLKLSSNVESILDNFNINNYILLMQNAAKEVEKSSDIIKETVEERTVLISQLEQINNELFATKDNLNNYKEVVKSILIDLKAHENDAMKREFKKRFGTTDKKLSLIDNVFSELSDTLVSFTKQKKNSIVEASNSNTEEVVKNNIPETIEKKSNEESDNSSGKKVLNDEEKKAIIDQVESYRVVGLTIREACDNLNISERTYHNYRTQLENKN